MPSNWNKWVTINCLITLLSSVFYLNIKLKYNLALPKRKKGTQINTVCIVIIFFKDTVWHLSRILRADFSSLLPSSHWVCLNSPVPPMKQGHVTEHTQAQDGGSTQSAGIRSSSIWEIYSEEQKVQLLQCCSNFLAYFKCLSFKTEFSSNKITKLTKALCKKRSYATSFDNWIFSIFCNSRELKLRQTIVQMGVGPPNCI